MNASLAQVARVTRGVLHGEDAVFTRINTDTRNLAAGELFVALQGEQFDGHDYVASAAEKGAAGALVARAVQAHIPEVRVADTRLALGSYAQSWREQFDFPVIGVTGSNGKTTVKQLLASIMASKGEVLATRGNLNNDIGVPLTLLELRAEHSAAVVEMGANHPGEIRYLARLARPTVGIVTNAGAAHLEGFGDLDGVARAKGELFEEIQDGGTAIINADDNYADFWRELAAPRRVVTFGLEAAADFSARAGSLETTSSGSRFCLQTPDGEVDIALHLPGRHNVRNALGAAAAAWAAGAQREHIARGLAASEGVTGRLRLLRGKHGGQVVDDTYNANPASLRAALDWLRNTAAPVYLVLGDMKELGPRSAELHAECGQYARTAGVTRLYGLGEFSRHAVQAFGAEGAHYATPEELLQQLGADLTPDSMVLIKGSRGMRMERIVAALIAGDD